MILQKKPAKSIIEYLNTIEETSRPAVADKIMRELMGLSKSYKDESDQRVVYYVMNDIKDFLSTILKHGFEKKSQSLPLFSYIEITIT